MAQKARQNFGKSGGFRLFGRRRETPDNIRRRFLLASKTGPFQYLEAYNSLRTNLKFVSMNQECRKIIVTSAIPGEGKSSVAINLAVSLAQDGSRVLLVDCDLRKPVVHRYLKVARIRGKGLTGVLAGAPLESAIVSVENLSIQVLAADAIPPNPAELLGSQRMEQVIGQMEQHYDFMIFDTPPVSVVTDAAVLSRYVDGVLLVVRQNYAALEQVQLAKRNLEQVHAKILGAVLNQFDAKSADQDSGYYYSYQYDYS